jgi:hypothetical protein
MGICQLIDNEFERKVWGSATGRPLSGASASGPYGEPCLRVSRSERRLFAAGKYSLRQVRAAVAAVPNCGALHVPLAAAGLRVPPPSAVKSSPYFSRYTPPAGGTAA